MQHERISDAGGEAMPEVEDDTQGDRGSVGLNVVTIALNVVTIVTTLG